MTYLPSGTEGEGDDFGSSGFLEGLQPEHNVAPSLPFRQDGCCPPYRESAAEAFSQGQTIQAEPWVRDAPEVLEGLKTLWGMMGFPCGKRLIPCLLRLVPRLGTMGSNLTIPYGLEKKIKPEGSDTCFGMLLQSWRG